jgi:hypothetical protein
MLTERIIGAFTFRKGVYAEVESDTTFTQTAWIIVVVVAFLNQLGSNASTNILNWLGGAVIGTIFAVIGFAVGALVINWIGGALFNADVTFDELVRTLGLAYVWQIIGFLGVVSAFSTALQCILAPLSVIACGKGSSGLGVVTNHYYHCHRLDSYDCHRGNRYIYHWAFGIWCGSLGRSIWLDSVKVV